MLIDLDDGRAMQPRVVGAKAARLASALGAGLPVLPGVVVAADVGRAVLARAAASLERDGSGGARLAAMEAPVEQTLVTALRQRLARLGAPVVVRSSSPHESDGRWAGAFSSFEGVEPEDLPTALRGVWASAFTVDALDRCRATGTDPASLALAVLIQRQLRPVCGGSATLVPGGAVAVHAALGSPRDLMGGWASGAHALVTREGEVEDRDGAAVVGAAPLRAAADLARRVHDVTEDGLIEWAWTGRDIALLQASPAPSRTKVDVTAPRGLDHPLALRVARLVTRFPGALGEALVLPWATALPDGLPPCRDHAATDPVADLSEAVAAATELTQHAWQDDAGRAREAAAATLAGLRGPEPTRALTRLAALSPVEPAEACTVVGLLEGVATAMAARGRVSGPREFWRQPLDVAEAIAGGRDTTPRAAHLVEVATSLGTPAVLGADLGPLGGLRGLSGSMQVAAVDGGRGAVHVVEA